MYIFSTHTSINLTQLTQIAIQYKKARHNYMTYLEHST